MAGSRTRSRKPDFLDEFVAERAARNPAFRPQVHEALRRRELMRSLGRLRTEKGLTQREIAARMRTSQPAIVRVESGEADVRTSTLERYAAALGHRVEYRLVPRR